MPIHLYSIKECQKLSKKGDYKRRLLCGMGIYSEQTPSLVIVLKNLCIYSIFLILIRCTNNFPPFFIKNWAFIVKERNLIFYSKHGPSLATTFSYLSGSIRIPRRKNTLSFEAIHESTQFLVFSYTTVGKN